MRSVISLFFDFATKMNIKNILGRKKVKKRRRVNFEGT